MGIFITIKLKVNELTGIIRRFWERVKVWIEFFVFYFNYLFCVFLVSVWSEGCFWH